jgi:hypothetical protein
MAVHRHRRKGSPANGLSMSVIAIAGIIFPPLGLVVFVGIVIMSVREDKKKMLEARKKYSE